MDYRVISKTTVENNVAKFKFFGILHRIGVDNNGLWKIV